MTRRIAPPRDSSVMSDLVLELEDDGAARAEVEEATRIVHACGDVLLDCSAFCDEDAEDA